MNISILIPMRRFRGYVLSINPRKTNPIPAEDIKEKEKDAEESLTIPPDILKSIILEKGD